MYSKPYLHQIRPTNFLYGNLRSTDEQYFCARMSLLLSILHIYVENKCFQKLKKGQIEHISVNDFIYVK